MISKKNVALLFCALPIFLVAREVNIKNGGMAVLRPVLFRSEFVSRGTLRAFQQNSMKDGFNVFGFPKFQNIYIKRDLHFYETKLAQTRYYARYLNREFKQYIIAHPDKFSVQTIKLYKAGYTSKNPVTVDGVELQWHHGKDGYELVPVSEHGKIPHTGGAKTYGYKYAEASAKIPNREIILTAQRWGKFVALDLAFSTIGIGISGETDWRTYAMNAVASTTAGFVAWGLESLLITSFPLLHGSTPAFISGIAVNIGGPASWIATGAFLLIKYSIMAGWERYQIQTALAVEQRCRQAEKMVCFANLKRQCQRNTEKLQDLLVE